ncbi:MAG TPA: DUF3696 domain-containing protein [Ramlibacter sp.]|nr:DUF3696 domain-containing protein [Ramlibacter sp.]
MLTAMLLENFKSWQSTEPVRLAPLTGLFGTNSSGKTSLLQFLLLLKQTAESTDRNLVLDLGDARSRVELGTFREILHRHDLGRTLGWMLAWDSASPLAVTDPTRKVAELQSGTRLGLSSDIRWVKNGGSGSGRAAVPRMSYHFEGSAFGMRELEEHPGYYELTAEETKLKFKRAKGRPWNLPPPVKCYGFPDQVRAYFRNAGFLSDFELAFESLMSRVYYLGPLREYPKREYPWGGAQPSDMGQRGERVVEALLASLDQDVRYSYGKGQKRRTLVEVVATWLKDLGLIDSFEVRPVAPGSKLFQVWVRRQPGAEEVLLTDVGFGVSQILPVITLCYYAPEGSVLLLEQPEIHLHPKVQAGLADVFIDAIRRRGVQIILESHSEHLLRRLQRNIAEEKYVAQDAALYFCEIESGVSRLLELNVDLYGNIQNWPEGFFGDEMAEIAAMQKAILRRRGVKV